MIDRPCVENRRGLGSVIIIIIIVVRYNKQYTRVVVNVRRSLGIVESKTEFKKYVYIYIPNKLMIYANDTLQKIVIILICAKYVYGYSVILRMSYTGDFFMLLDTHYFSLSLR